MKKLEDYLYYEESNPSLKIYHGDCLEIMPLLGKVDLICTDPPYGINIAANPFRQKHEKQDWDLEPIDKERLAMMREISNDQIIWGGNYFDLPPTQCFLVWDKVQPEDFSSSMCEMAWTSMKKPAKMFKRHVVSYQKWHPTQKPLELMNWCILQNGDSKTILDPFMGVGTTLVACKELNRNGIGIEISRKYCDIAVTRLKNTTKSLF